MLTRILREKEDLIAGSWADMVISTYPEETAGFLNREKDPFANPMGQLIREAAPVLVRALDSGKPDREAVEVLDRLMRLRSVQDWSAGQAVGIVHLLRRAVLKEAGGSLDRELLLELVERVEQLSLRAFDIFTACREQLYEVRLHERDRHHASLLKRAEQMLEQYGGQQTRPSAESPEGGRIA